MRRCDIPNLTASRARRALITGILALGPFLIGGCGVPVVGQVGQLLGGGQPSGAALDEQLEEARSRTTMDPDEPFWPFRAAELHLLRGERVEATEALKTSLARRASYAPAISLLSKLYFEDSRHEEAIVLLEELRANRRAFPEGMPHALLEGLALHYDALGRPDLAARTLEGAPSGDGSPTVYLTLRGDNPDMAKGLARAELEKSPRSAISYNNFAITRLRDGDPEEARRAFLTAMRLAPDLPGPYYNMAILEKYYLFDDEAAARWFKRYRDRAVEDPDGLAEVFRQQPPGGLAEKRDP